MAPPGISRIMYFYLVLPLESRKSGIYMIFIGFRPPGFESLCKHLYMQRLCYISSHISWLRGYLCDIISSKPRSRVKYSFLKEKACNPLYLLKYRSKTFSSKHHEFNYLIGSIKLLKPELHT